MFAGISYRNYLLLSVLMSPKIFGAFLLGIAHAGICGVAPVYGLILHKYIILQILNLSPALHEYFLNFRFIHGNISNLPLSLFWSFEAQCTG